MTSTGDKTVITSTVEPERGPVDPASGKVLPAPTTPPPLRRRWRRGRFGIQSKLLIMLLTVSILSTLTVGYIGYHAGTHGLREAAFERMTGLRVSRTRELHRMFSNLQEGLVLLTNGFSVIEATRRFTGAFDELETATITPEQDAAVESYYEDVFVTTLTERSGLDVQPEAFLPETPAQQYLQAHYTAPFDNFDEALAFDDAGDGSAWSTTHARFQPYFRKLVEIRGYEDVLLFDTEGNVIYTAYKGVDLGTNIQTGPYQESNLREAYDQIMRANSVDLVTVTDFDRYQPSYDVPTLFALSAVGEEGALVGVMAIQVPIDSLNNLMTGDQEWAEDGFGETGETYLVGADGLMRSVSRPLLEDPAQFADDVVANGTPTRVADRMVEVNGSILLQRVENEATERAFTGERGTTVARDYTGDEVLLSFGRPIDVEGLEWVVLAQIDTSEAFEEADHFARELLITIAALVLLVSVASLILAQVFTRPIRRLVTGVRRVAAGDLDATVDVRSKDEFGDLAAAFNEMSGSLRTKSELLEEQQRANDEMLLTMMPEPVARRYKGGEETIAEDHYNVTVIFADVVGFDEFSEPLPSDQALTLLNGLVRTFDEAAETHGMERVRTLRRGYLASCGLVTPRIDHVRRTVDFAQDMQRSVERFNLQHDAELALRVGIDTGTVTSGLVGRSSVMYDMWGDAVNLAFRVQEVSGQPGIFVTADVYDRLRNSAYAFEEAGQIDTKDGPQLVWRLRPPTATT